MRITYSPVTFQTILNGLKAKGLYFNYINMSNNVFASLYENHIVPFQTILNGLKAKGHVIGSMQGQSIVQSVDVLNNGIVAVADFRKGGVPSGY